jgi:hypothetical protein
MRGWVWGVTGVVLVIVLTRGMITDPLLTAAGISAVVIGLLLLGLPKDRIAGYAGSAAIAALILVPVQNIGSYGALRFAVLAFIGALVVIASLRRLASFSKPSRGYLFLVAYFALVGLTTLIHPGTADLNLYLSAVVAALGMLVLGLISSPDERRMITRTVVVLATAEALYALLEFALRLSPLWADGNAGERASQIFAGASRAQGTLAHPLPLALLLIVSMTLIVRGAVKTRKRLPAVLHVGVMLAGVLATGSRSAIIVAVLVLLLGIPFKAWKVAFVGGYLIIVGAVTLGVGGFFQGHLFVSFVTGSSVTHRSGALEAIPRLVQLQDAAALIFGNGYFAGNSLFDRGLLQAGSFRAIDNQWVTSLVEGGALGVALLAAAIIAALLVGGKERLALIVVVVYFFTFDVLSWPFGAAIFGCLMGLCFGHGRTQHESAPSVAKSARNMVRM